jgi:hypothetical protein
MIRSAFASASATGWCLLGACLVLTLFNLRKKLAFLPLGSGRLWLWCHSWIGLLGLVLFVAHTGARVPTGVLETTLWGLFVFTSLSGVAGLCWSRWSARRMARLGAEVIYEQIPAQRTRLAETLESAVLAAAERSQSTTLLSWYAERIAPYLRAPCWTLDDQPARSLTRALEAKLPLLGGDERPVAEQAIEAVRAKALLDQHHTLQLSSKLWLFVHLGATAALWVLALVHVLLVWQWSLA